MSMIGPLIGGPLDRGHLKSDTSIVSIRMNIQIMDKADPNRPLQVTVSGEYIWHDKAEVFMWNKVNYPLFDNRK